MIRLLPYLHLLVALLNPQFTAYWDSATSSTVSWVQPSRACLYYNSPGGTQTWVNCYEGVGPVTVTFGHQGPLSGDLRPKTGGSYLLTIGSDHFLAKLRGRPRYLPILRA